MAREYKLIANKTKPGVSYATRENAIKAVERVFPEADNDGLRYFIHTCEDGRFLPVFIGQEAMKAGVHFLFHVVG